MADVVINVRTEGGDKTVNSIKSLKDAIKELEQAGENLDLGSEAYQENISQVEALKKKLNELGKTREQLAKEEADRQAKAAADAQKAADAITKAEEQRISDAHRATEEQRANAEKIGNNLQKFAAGLTDAFAGAFIALGASEKDAEKFNKTLEKGIGIAIGVKGGIEALVAAVELAGPAFEAFNAIMAANPIGATIVVITALAASIYLLIKALSAEKTESEKLTKQLEEQKLAAERLKTVNANETAILEAKIGLMKAQGKSNAEILKAEAELYEIKKKGLQQDLIQLELSANVTKAKLQESLAEQSLTEAYLRKSAAIAKSLGQDKEARLLEMMANKVRLDDSKEITDQLSKDLTAISQLKNKLAVLDIQQQTKVAEFNAKSVEAAKKRNEELKKLRDQQLKDEADALQKQLDDLNKYNAEQKALLETQREEEIDDSDNFYARKHAKAIKTAQNALIGDEDNLTKKRRLLDEQRQEEIRIAQQTGEDVDAINRKYAKLDEELAEESFRKKMANVNKYTQAVGSALNSVVGAFQAYQDLQRQNEEQDTKERQEALDTQLTALNATRDAELEKEGLTAEQKKAINYKYAMQEYELKLLEYNRNTEVKKKAFEQDKKLKIAQTVISTITGAVAALNGMIQTIPGPVGIALGAVSAAAIVATGALQVAAISKQKFDAGSPPQAPTLAPPSTSGAGGDNQPGPQAGPDLYRINGDTNTGGGQGQRRAGGGNEPIKAYVVSQEVTTSQNMNNVIERRSSF